ncbi:hypothetical protein EXIGLDRAFT_772590 [Exidia glandulosa HHB12029]|uniref:SH3 domain-containing protein n=1 Tax=Exidia glandulosa HHB12029 TaxID=1314781 RepID=A0A165F7W0_EXIGL|nr:hypothetical protein EXIGLDRAFT_772590 [Exidia glandulosa HHB12029]
MQMNSIFVLFGIAICAFAAPLARMPPGYQSLGVRYRDPASGEDVVVAANWHTGDTVEVRASLEDDVEA